MHDALHTPFKNCLVITRKSDPSLRETVREVMTVLADYPHPVALEQSSAERLKLHQEAGLTLAKPGDQHDLLIVVGGDGSILQIAQTALRHDMAVLGINQGRLGFLTDISAHELAVLPDVLMGGYEEEHRLMLEMQMLDAHGTALATQQALNDVVLLPGMLTRMIEFDLYVDDHEVCQQRSDGIIAATPTGSTAHAMSAGGPIVHPGLDAITLVPLCPHRLSSRPIVVPARQQITWHISPENAQAPNISCDGSEAMAAPLGGKVVISAATEKLRLIHPAGHNHYHTLQQKLGWESL